MLRGPRRRPGSPLPRAPVLPFRQLAAGRGMVVSGRRGGGSSSKRARKAASREALRRRAERRVYKPASFLILFKLACMYVGLTALRTLTFSSRAGCYVNPRANLDPAGDYLWNVLCCFSLLGLPVLLLHLAGYVFLPPVWPEHFPDRDKALEELGGKLYFRFHRRRRGNPNAARRAVEVAVEVLSRTLPSTLWEVEVITEDDTSRLASANIREFVLPPDRVASAAAWTRGDGNRDDDGVGACELLSYGVERSTAGWGDWVVHMGADAILNQRAVDAVVAHAARESRLVALSPASKPRSRRAAQARCFPGSRARPTRWRVGCRRCSRGSPRWRRLFARVKTSADAIGVYPPDGDVARPERVLGGAQRAGAIGGVAHGAHPAGHGDDLFALRCQDKGARFAVRRGRARARHPGRRRAVSPRVRDHAGALLLMGEDVALSAQAQIFLGLTCVSAGFATLAPVLTAAAPFITHEPGPEAFAAATAVGACSALARCKYAVGFLTSRAAPGTSRGARRDTSSTASSSPSPCRSFPRFRSSNSRRCARRRAAPSPRAAGDKTYPETDPRRRRSTPRTSLSSDRTGKCVDGRRAKRRRGSAGRTPTRARAPS